MKYGLASLLLLGELFAGESIAMSHGTGGSLSSHIDTANALARAGFVVLAVTHIGDNTHVENDSQAPDAWNGAVVRDR